jgi:hypothetical protein
MPQLTREERYQQTLANASSDVQKKHGYNPEIETVSVSSGPEKDAPIIQVNKFDLISNPEMLAHFKDMDEQSKGVKENYNFSYQTTIKNVFDGAYDNAVNSKDKEISNSWKAFKDEASSYLVDFTRAQKGELTEDELTDFNFKQNNLLGLWNTAQRSLKVYYDEKAGEDKARSDEGKKLWYSPVADRMVSGLEFERKESDIYTGEFFSDVGGFVEKRNTTKFEAGVTAWSLTTRGLGGVINWALGIDPDDLKESESSKLAGYEDAYSMVNNTDPKTELASRSLTETYFARATQMTINDKQKNKYFEGKESAFVTHNQNLERNVVSALNLMKETDNEKALELSISLKQATAPGNKNGFNVWLKNNRKEFLQLTKDMTPVQSVSMYKQFGANGDIFDNPFYFDKVKTIGEDKITGWVNTINPYIDEQRTLRRDLNKIGEKVIGKMRNERNPDYMQNEQKGYSGDYTDALILNKLIVKGVQQDANYISSNIGREAEALAKKYPQYGPNPNLREDFNTIMKSQEENLLMGNNAAYTSFIKDQAATLAGTNFLPGLNKEAPEPTDAEKRLMDWYFRPAKGGQQASINDAGVLSGKEWMENSGEFNEEIEKLSREYKIEFGNQSTDEVFAATIMRDGFGKEGSQSLEYRRVSKNDENAVKTKHFNKVVDLSKKALKNKGSGKNVYIKDGELSHTDQPDMYSEKSSKEKLELLNNFFKNEDKSEYKISYINKTSDDDKIAYMISEYDGDKDTFKNHITLFVDRDYAVENEEIFSENTYSDLSDDRYKVRGYYDLSSLNDDNFSELKLESKEGGMYLTGNKEDGEELDLFIGSNQTTTVDRAIEKVRAYKNYLKNLKTQ